jgi:hypothetical protein
MIVTVDVRKTNKSGRRGESTPAVGLSSRETGQGWRGNEVLRKKKTGHCPGQPTGLSSCEMGQRL